MLLIYLYLISIRQLLCVRFLHLLCSVFGYSHEWNLLRLETQPQGRVPRLPVHTSCVCIRTGTCGGTDQLCEFCSCPSVVGPAGPSTRAAYGTATLGRPVSLYIRAGTHAAPLNQIGAVKFRPWWSDPRHACLDLPRAMWRGGDGEKLERSPSLNAKPNSLVWVEKKKKKDNLRLLFNFSVDVKNVIIFPSVSDLKWHLIDQKNKTKHQSLFFFCSRILLVFIAVLSAYSIHLLLKSAGVVGKSL